MILNVGNSCYLGAALQCIARTPGFLEHCKRDMTDEDGLRLVSFLDALRTGSGVLDPSALYDQLREYYPYFGEHQQHDCHEAIVVVLDYLDSKMGGAPSAVRTFFKLDRQTCIRCETCGHVRASEQEEYGLYESYFTEEIDEILDGYHCDHCGTVDCQSSSKIVRHPPVMIVRLPKDLDVDKELDVIDIEGKSFKLFAMCKHIPMSDEGGHYIAMVRGEECWNIYNDETCTTCESVDVNQASVLLLLSTNFSYGDAVCPVMAC